MTAKQENTLIKWMIGVFAGVVVTLLTFQAGITNALRKDMINFIKENSMEHRKLEKALNQNYDWTHSVYMYEIEPNTIRSKSNEKRLNKAGL